MNDDQAEAVALAVMALAVTVRDEGPAAVTHAAGYVLAAAGGDLVAALAVAAVLIEVDRPPSTWWQQTDFVEFSDPRHPAHGTHTGHNRHRARGQRSCDTCVAAERRYQAERHLRRKPRRKAS